MIRLFYKNIEEKLNNLEKPLHFFEGNAIKEKK